MAGNDYSLLHLFTLDAAKRGEPVAWVHDGALSKQVVVLDSGKVVIEWADGEVQFYALEEGDARFLRMAPLAWVEGKPVYPGDELYDIADGAKVIAEGQINGGLEIVSGSVAYGFKRLSWARPKVKREGFIVFRPLDVFDSAEQAAYCTGLEADCRVGRVEWEEPA